MNLASKFDDIIAVTEDVNGKWSSYYLTKSGKTAGRDSLFYFDNNCDCESEGLIRFRDHKTDKTGMFNKNGDIVIPAEYNDMTRVRNGMVIALKGAEKKYMDYGEHFSWVGGEEYLIDTTNKVLIDNFRLDNNQNFFSLKISSNPDSDTLRQNFKGTNGQYYSFIDYEKEFRVWLKTSLLENPTKDRLRLMTFKTIVFWKEPEGWVKEDKEAFINRNFDLIKSKLVELSSLNCDYNIFGNGLNPYIFNTEEYTRYFNNCGEPKEWIYPVKDIVINHSKKKKLSKQDHLEFLRTVDGYKLISITIQNIN
ncbi:MAG: hypothetical protein WCP85_15365 [Mariniphaga sp.]